MTETVGQFTVPPLAGAQLAAAQIAASTQSTPEAAGTIPAYRQATVVSANGGTPPTCTVTFDGTTNVAGVRHFGGYYPVANDVVVCIALGGVTWILGSLAKSSTLTVPSMSVTDDLTAVSVSASGTGDALYATNDIRALGTIRGVGMHFTGNGQVDGVLQATGRDVPIIVGSATGGVTYLADETAPICLCFGSVSVNFNGTTSARSGNINPGFNNILGGVGALNMTNNFAIPGCPVNTGTAVFVMQYSSNGTIAAGARTGYFVVWGN